MSYGLRFTSKYTRHLSLSAYRLARSAAILDFLAMLLSDRSHGPAFDVKLVGYQLEHVVRAGFHAFATSVAFVGVNYDEIVA
jgi:hypothetical protein